MEPEPVELKDVRRLRLGPGDVLVARVPSPARWVEIERVKRQLEAFFPDNLVVVTTDDIDLTVVEGA